MITLSDLCLPGGVQTGPFGSQLHAEEYSSQGVPVVMPQDIGDNRIEVDAIARVPEDVALRLARHRLKPGDIVYSRRGDVERRAWVSDNQNGWLCGTGCLRVRVNPSLADSRFVSYYLGTSELRSWIVSHAVGATMLNLNTSILAAVPMTVPSIVSQRSIAEALGALDDKIAANAALDRLLMNVLLTEFSMMQRSAVVESRFGQLAELRYGRALPASARVVGDVVVYGSGGVTGTHNEALCRAPGIVVGRKGTVGAVYWADRDFFPIDTVFYIVPKDAISLEYLFFLLRSLRLAELNSDSAVPGLNRDEAYAQPVRVASSEEIAEFSARARCLFARASAARTESDQLATLRDTLLPHLMSGRITVSEAEKAVEEVL